MAQLHKELTEKLEELDANLSTLFFKMGKIECFVDLTLFNKQLFNPKFEV